jgi:hypothetical protein
MSLRHRPKVGQCSGLLDSRDSQHLTTTQCEYNSQAREGYRLHAVTHNDATTMQQRCNNDEAEEETVKATYKP